MDPMMIGGAMGLGSAFQGYMNMKSQEKTNEANLAIAREQMAFQERMANSAHQREMEDMRKAGLNPILSKGGSGASTPSGASATMVNPGTFLGDVISGGINSGLQAAQLEADLRIKNASVAKTLAETINTQEQSKVIAEDIRGRRASNAVSEALVPSEIERGVHVTEKTRHEKNRAKYEAGRSATSLEAEQFDLPRLKGQSEIDRDLIKYDNTIRRLQNGIDTATSGLNVSRYLRAPVLRPGSRAEKKALEKAGSKGLEVKSE